MSTWFSFIFLSNLHAVAEGEADAAVGVDRHMIRQFSPGFRIESRHLLRQAVMGAVKFLGGVSANKGGRQKTAGTVKTVRQRTMTGCLQMMVILFVQPDSPAI